MFNKRIYNLPNFTTDLTGLVRNLPHLVSAFRSGRVSPAFREKLILAVTGVNECRYCAFVHTLWARGHQIRPGEIAGILGGTFGDDLDPDQRFALEFAAHYAETGKSPDPEMLDRLKETFGERTAEDMLAFLEMITLANLTANTFDGFLARLRGEGAEGSSPLFEAALALVVAPALLPQAALFSARRRGLLPGGPS